MRVASIAVACILAAAIGLGNSLLCYQCTQLFADSCTGRRTELCANSQDVCIAEYTVTKFRGLPLKTIMKCGNPSLCNQEKIILLYLRIFTKCCNSDKCFPGFTENTTQGGPISTTSIISTVEVIPTFNSTRTPGEPTSPASASPEEGNTTSVLTTPSNIPTVVCSDVTDTTVDNESSIQTSLPTDTSEEPSQPSESSIQTSLPANTSEEPSQPSESSIQTSLPTNTSEEPSQPSLPTNTSEQPSQPSESSIQTSLPTNTTEQPSQPSESSIQTSLPANTSKEPSQPSESSNQTTQNRNSTTLPPADTTKDSASHDTYSAHVLLVSVLAGIVLSKPFS